MYMEKLLMNRLLFLNNLSCNLLFLEGLSSSKLTTVSLTFNFFLCMWLDFSNTKYNYPISDFRNNPAWYQF